MKETCLLTSPRAFLKGNVALGNKLVRTFSFFSWAHHLSRHIQSLVDFLNLIPAISRDSGPSERDCFADASLFPS